MFKLTGKKLFGVLLVAGVVASAVAGPAAADEYSQGSDPELVINAGVGPRFDDVNGSSIFPTVNDFQPITLNGTAKLAVATINPFVVIDDSGDEAGWNVTLQIADLLDGTGAGCATGSTHTIADRVSDEAAGGGQRHRRHLDDRCVSDGLHRLHGGPQDRGSRPRPTAWAPTRWRRSWSGQ